MEKNHSNDRQPPPIEEHDIGHAAWWPVLLDQHRDGIVVLDAAGAVCSVSQQFANMLGYTKQEVFDLYAWDWDAILSKERLLPLLELADSSGITFQTVHRRKDGSTVDVEITGSVTIHHGNKRILCICRDITERRKAEKALQESEERYRAVVDQAVDAFTLMDEQGLIIDANQAACDTLGYSREELLRLYLYDVDVLAKPSGHKENYWEKLGPGNRLYFESRLKCKDGTLIPVDVSLGQVELGNRRLMMGLSRDITQRKKLEQQLSQAQKMEAVGQLAGGVAHDFNNMLGVILGSVELVMDQLDPSQPIYVMMQTIRKAAERSADLTRQLLAFARKQTVIPKMLDLNRTIEGMLRMLRRLIGEDIKLVWLPGTRIPPVKMDPTQIDQILANLCVNARQAISNVGNVTIETGTTFLDEDYCATQTGLTPGQFVKLTVSDDGHGMNREVRGKIFEPFFTTKEVGQGTGLGLATVYGIVKQNYGAINVYSEPEIGTTFKIYLPAHIPHNSLEAGPSSPKPIERGNETILLVEDEFTMMNMGKNMLEKFGYRVLTATTPGLAITLAEEHAGQIHLLLSDIMLPEMNGRDLADKIATFQPGMKILYMSGYTPSEFSRRGLTAEQINFLQKPFTMQTLGAKVREILDRSS